MSSYILGEIRYRLSRFGGNIAGIAIGVGLFVALVAAGNGFAAAASQPLSDVGADIVISRPATQTADQVTRGVRQPFGLASITTQEADQIAEVPGVSSQSGGLLLWDFSANTYQTLLGVDLAPNDPGSDVDISGPAALANSVSKGRFLLPDDTGVVVVDQHYSAFFGLMPGSTVEIGETSFDVVGIVSAEGGNQSAGANFYLTLADAQDLAGLPNDQLNQVYVSVGEAANVEAVVSDSQTRLGDISATTQQSIVSVMGGITEVADRFSTLSALAALIGGLLLTGVTINAGINLRSSDIGIMKSLGWRSRDVVKLLTLEGLVLGLAGAAVGLVLGWLIVFALSRLPIDPVAISGTSPGLTELAPSEPINIAASLDSKSVLIALAAATLGSGTISMVSAARTARLKPADSMRR